MVIMLVHCDSIITRLSGSLGGKTRDILATVVQNIFNAISFTGFHIHKQIPHPPGMGHQLVYLVVWL